ncbi:nucleotide sugar dehydrogenase [Minwuia thermotolerans]|uniref:Nucleotide sugar dehydrogenase n=1 Tax=Minwuia thermotolerans TaxID=2056226 RepID=A0A2M9FY36_9PROT|nr:nucleotide sugar dehydrogenase [Minwuia thermotolerans]PJK28373.1 nucleotide sugar dehydrogenase [Minwuia thermotolerans]
MTVSERIAVVGLGYVGLPLAVAFARAGLDVVGYDISRARVEELAGGHDHTGEVEDGGLAGLEGMFTCEPERLADRTVYIFAVPTPVDSANVPDFGALLGACRLVGPHLRPGDLVVIESTVYPGVTEEICGPELARISGLKLFEEIKLGYSPERINPGDREHTLERIVKVVSGQDAETLGRVRALYDTVIKAGTHPAESIKVAEAAKVIENIQRDINIALVNELAMLFDRMGIETEAVLRASGTKWNFLPFRPGLVGGHCIGVDPYYLTHRAEQLGFHTQMISAGRRINDSVAGFVAQKVLELLYRHGRKAPGRKAAILGLTFKENVPDLRNSKVEALVRQLGNYGLEVVAHDPVVGAAEVREELGLTLCGDDDVLDADCVILAVPHDAYLKDDAAWVIDRLGDDSIVVDIKSRLPRARLKPSQVYWSL